MNALPILMLGGALLLLAKKPSKSSDSGATKPPKAGERPDDYVWFNEDFSEYEISTGWRIRVLDRWLENQYDEGKIVTLYRPDLANQWEGDPSWYLGAGKAAAQLLELGIWFLKLSPKGRIVSWGAPVLASLMSYVTVGQFDSAVHQEAIESTGVGALSLFSQTHQVYVGESNTPMLIAELPDTPAVQDFMAKIAGYIGRFQASDMESI